MIGEFEYLLITAAARLGEEAYGAAIREEIEAATKSKNSLSQGKKFPWCFIQSFAASVTYDIVDLHLDP